MHKVSQILQNHIDGKQTGESSRLFASVKSELVKCGFKSPFFIQKIAEKKIKKHAFKIEKERDKLIEDIVKLRWAKLWAEENEDETSPVYKRAPIDFVAQNLVELNETESYWIEEEYIDLLLDIGVDPSRVEDINAINADVAISNFSKTVGVKTPGKKKKKIDWDSGFIEDEKLRQDLMEDRELDRDREDFRSDFLSRQEEEEGQFASNSKWLKVGQFDDDYDRSEFADPHGRSALRAGKRIYPCPTCKKPNSLTAKDVALHYQCDECADRAEGFGD